MSNSNESGASAVVVAGWGPMPHRGVYATLLLASMALLMLEVSLTRFFSFTVWYHLAYLTISMALLGFGSSGAIVAAFPNLFRRRGQDLLVYGLVLGALATFIGLAFLSSVPLEVSSLTAVMVKGDIPFKFSAVLLLYYLAVVAPFLLAGMAIGVPFAAYPRMMGKLYFYDLLGAAAGCILVVALIEVFSVPGLIIAAGGLMIASAAVLSLGGGGRTAAGVLGVVAVLVVALAPTIGGNLQVDATKSKGLGNFREAIKRDDVFTRWTALNRIDAFGWDHPSKIQYWLMAGMKEGYTGRRPDVARVVYDGSNGSNIYSYDGSMDDYEFLEHHLLRTPYLVRDKPKVLVIGVGGGIDMFNAIKQGARHVTGVELQPKTVHVLKEHIRDFTGGFYDRDDVTLLAGEGRHYIRKTDEIYDMIEITAVDTFAAQATGAYILAESYLYTVEAQQDYFARLSDDGLLSMVVGDIRHRDGVPPLATRLALNGYRALQRMGVEDPGQHIMVVNAVTPHRWSQAENILVKRQPFSADEVRTVQRHAAANGFGLLYAPKLLAPEKFQLGVALGKDEAARQKLIDEEWFRVDAVYDSDPFFYNVGKWRNFSPRRSMLYLFPGSFIGQLVLVLMLTQSLILGIILICFPLLLGARQGVAIRGVLAYMAYFLALGIGFMFIEISFIQSFVLFLGSPTHALSVTIFALLLFSAIGSFLSVRFVDRAEWALGRLMWIVAAVVIVYSLALGSLFQAFLGLSMAARVCIAVIAQVPMGLTLGMFMPLGIACVSRRHGRLVPWAWGINGIGSVLGTTLAVILAMAYGFKVVAGCAVLLYLVGTSLMLRAQRTAA